MGTSNLWASLLLDRGNHIYTTPACFSNLPPLFLLLLLALDMSVLTRLSVLTFLSIALSSLAAPNILSRQAPAGGNNDVGWAALPELEGSILHKDWEMLGATFVSD